MKVIIMVCTKKFLVYDKWAILGPKLFFDKKIHLGQFDLFSLLAIFYCLGMVKLSQATVNWILKQSGHDFFHDY